MKCNSLVRIKKLNNNLYKYNLHSYSTLKKLN